MLKKMRKVFLLIMLALVLTSLVGCKEEGPKIPDVIDEAVLNDLKFEDATVAYDGTYKSIFVDNYLKEQGVQVSYKNNNRELPGSYTVIATITYEGIVIEKTATLTITGDASNLTAEAVQNFYTNSEVVLDYQLDNDIQEIVMVDATGKVVTTADFVKPGSYAVELYAPAKNNYSESNHVAVTINIVKSMYDLKFESKEVIANGEEYTIEFEGTIPAGFSVEYMDNKGTEDGKYFAKALLKDATGKVVETHQAVLTIDNPENAEFEKYLDEFFVLYLEDDQLSVNIFCENPGDFGLEHYEATWYAYESFDDSDVAESKAQFVELLEELEAFEDAKLNDLQVLAYNTLRKFIENNIEMYSIEDADFMNIVYVDQFGGYVADFGTYMEAYSLRSEQEVKDVVAYFESTKEAFPSYLKFVEDKANKGYPLSNFTIDSMRTYLNDLLADKDNYYLVEILNQKIDKLSFLDDTKKADYKAQIAKASKDCFMAGVEELFNGLEKFLNKLDKENEGYLAKYENGKDLYVAKLKDLLGYDGLNMDDYVKAVDAAFQAASSKALSAQNDLVSKTNVQTYEELEIVIANNSIFAGTPDEMMVFLKEFAKTIVPELKSNPDINIKEMDDAAAKASNAVAYYMKSALDNTAGENITLNPDKLGNSSNNDVLGTLAHEGYPGHLYAYVLSKESGISNLATIMSSTAHAEGWATYVELKLYEYGKAHGKGGVYDLVMDYLYANQLAGFLLETRIDVGIHYEGWDVSKVGSFLAQNGYSKDAAQEIYDLIIEMPTQYAAYGYGKVIFTTLHDEAKAVLGGYYDEIEFNTMLLSSGWVDLQELEDIYNDYMETKCFECGLEWNK